MMQLSPDVCHVANGTQLYTQVCDNLPKITNNKIYHKMLFYIVFDTIYIYIDAIDLLLRPLDYLASCRS